MALLAEGVHGATVHSLRQHLAENGQAQLQTFVTFLITFITTNAHVCLTPAGGQSKSEEVRKNVHSQLVADKVGRKKASNPIGFAGGYSRTAWVALRQHPGEKGQDYLVSFVTFGITRHADTGALFTRTHARPEVLSIGSSESGVRHDFAFRSKVGYEQYSGMFYTCQRARENILRVSEASVQ